MTNDGITAKVKDAMIPGSKLESCLTQVLVPSSRLSPMLIEVETSWTSQTSQSIRVHPCPYMDPCVGSKGLFDFAAAYSQ
ncbi:MAG TPA: hypothetical protein PKA58_29955 [Polyangium sp.]|nr:hypothetical protein [Polyangium sp.]